MPRLDHGFPLLFPARADGDYSLIVDGTAVVIPSESGPRMRITPTRAVLHRPAAAVDPTSACGADCAPILLESALAPSERRRLRFQSVAMSSAATL